MSKFYIVLSSKNTFPVDRTHMGIQRGKDVISQIFLEEFEACEYAKQLAIQNPQSMVHVLETHKIYETSEPIVISKKFNERGELVPER